MTRDEFDALIKQRITADLLADPSKDAEQQAQIDEAAWRDFADAVDRSGKTIGYEEAVVISGGAGQTVCTVREYRDNRAYWETVAAGHSGEVDWVAEGPSIVAYLRDPANA